MDALQSKQRVEDIIYRLVLPHYLTGEAVPLARVTPLGNGHINGTWRVDGPGGPWVLQQLNTQVFTTPWQLVNNAVVIARHLRQKQCQGQYALRISEPVMTLSGQWALDFGENGFWRAISYVPQSCALERLSAAPQARQVALTFGRFVAALADASPGEFHEVIPGFRALPQRLQALQHAAKQDKLQRLATCRQWYALAMAQQPLVAELAATIPLLPQRICHNDTKINNLLFSEDGCTPLAVVDLDTCMPGYLMYDFGDMVRSCCAAVAEDDTALAQVQLLPDYFAAIAEGWQQALGGIMTTEERQSLWLGTRVVTLMLAVRFLTDYLDGDRYFRISHPQHNLQRAANQFTLYQRLLAQEARLTAILAQ
ncbi:phosphotransferase enzyme family protein [Shewanella sp. YIC-542]|uniref:phosphotransferase enzyme family protein n=1 Tax=Shewanella mytili TaxID=3377111 RepID=UPI00398ED4F4